MATYPTLLQLYGSTRTSDDGTNVQRAISGRPRLHTYYSKVYNSFTVLHQISEADKTTLEGHYGTDAELSFPFTWDADQVTYTVRYASHPQYLPVQAGGLPWRVTVDFIEV